MTTHDTAVGRKNIERKNFHPSRSTVDEKCHPERRHDGNGHGDNHARIVLQNLHELRIMKELRVTGGPDPLGL